MVKSEQVRLADIFEVAYLMATGKNYQSVEIHKGKVRFTFSGDVIEPLQQFYGNDDVTVNPKDYMHKIKDVKNIVFGIRKENEMRREEER